MNSLLLQFQADLLQVPVQRPVGSESTALGAAYLAGLAVGYWQDQAEIAKTWTVDREFTPEQPPAEMHQRWDTWRRAVERSRDWAREEP